MTANRPSDTLWQDQHLEEKQGTEGCQYIPVKLPCVQVAAHPEVLETALSGYYSTLSMNGIYRQRKQTNKQTNKQKNQESPGSVFNFFPAMPFLCLPAELVFLPEPCKDLLHVFQSTPSIYSAGSWQQLSESTLRHHPMV